MATDNQILDLVDQDRVYWCKREGGSEAYQIHRKRLNELVSMGLVDVCSTCCYKEYSLTSLGRIALSKWASGGPADGKQSI